MNWKNPKGEETFFPWLQVLQQIEAEDPNLGSHPQEMAHELLGGSDCPNCGKRAGRLRWVCMPEDDRVGWLTVCTHCQTQVEWLFDEELTELRRDGNW
jgi:hypothetical protein